MSSYYTVGLLLRQTLWCVPSLPGRPADLVVRSVAPSRLSRVFRHRDSDSPQLFFRAFSWRGGGFSNAFDVGLLWLVLVCDARRDGEPQADLGSPGATHWVHRWMASARCSLVRFESIGTGPTPASGWRLVAPSAWRKC